MKGEFKMNTQNNILKLPDYKLTVHEQIPTSLEKMKRGYAAVLKNATWNDIENFHAVLGVSLGVDKIKDVSVIEHYVVYQDSAGWYHQLYSLIPESENSENIYSLEIPEHISTWLDKIECDAQQVLKSNSNDLTTLAQAQCKSVATKINIEKSNYYDSSKCPKDNTINCVLTHKFFAIHEINSNMDYYLVQQEGVYSFANCCAPVYKKSVSGALSKIQEWYGGEILENCYIKDDMSKVSHYHIERTSPDTTESSQSVTVGLNWSLSGNFTYNNNEGISAGINGGIEVINSTTKNINDITINNKSLSSGENAEWKYSFRKSSSHFSFFSYGQVELDNCAEAARNTYSTFSEWIVHVDRTAGDQLTWHRDSNIIMVSSRARLDYPFHTACAEKTLNFNIANQDIIINKPPTKV